MIVAMSFVSFCNRLSHNVKSEGFLAFIVRMFAKKSFGFFERFFSLHLTPAHFYSPIPTVSKLSDNVYDKVFTSVGLVINSEKQLELGSSFYDTYSFEFSSIGHTALSYVDTFLLYSFVRSKKPRKIVEIGAGDSTFIILSALHENGDTSVEFTSIEPYPKPKLLNITDNIHHLVVKKVQDVPPDFFRDVDLLFIDSSHVSKIDSDVNYEILELLPLLPPGALIHFHDIVFPRNYWRDWIANGNQFWNESYLLHAFLLFNDTFCIKWASQYLQTFHEPQLSRIFPFFSISHRLTSFWIERTK